MTPLTPDSTPEEVREAWVAALESGDYEQTTDGQLGYPYDPGGAPSDYCCLGVLCDLAIKAGLIKDEGIDGRFNWGAAFPECQVADWAGLAETDGTYEHTSLASDNDNGSSFAAIADIIRAAPEGLLK